MTKMKKTGEWGDEIILRAVADLLQVSITVLHSAGNVHKYEGGHKADLCVAFDQKRQHYLGTSILPMSVPIYRPWEMRGLQFKNHSGKPIFPSKQELKQLKHELSNLNLRLGQSNIGQGLGLFTTKRMNPPETQPGFHSGSKTALVFKGEEYTQREWREITRRADEVNFPPEEPGFDLVAATRFPYAIEHYYALQKSGYMKNIIINAGDEIACAARYAQHSSGQNKNCIMISQEDLPQPFLALTEKVEADTEIAWDYTDMTNNTNSSDSDPAVQEMAADESSDEPPNSPLPRTVKLLTQSQQQQKKQNPAPGKEAHEILVPTVADAPAQSANDGAKVSPQIGNAVWSPTLKKRETIDPGAIKQKQEKPTLNWLSEPIQQEKPIDEAAIKEKRRKAVKHLTNEPNKTKQGAAEVKTKRRRSARQLAGSFTTNQTIPNIMRKAAQQSAAKEAAESAKMLASIAAESFISANEPKSAQPAE